MGPRWGQWWRKNDDIEETFGGEGLTSDQEEALRFANMEAYRRDEYITATPHDPGFWRQMDPTWVNIKIEMETLETEYKRRSNEDLTTVNVPRDGDIRMPDEVQRYIVKEIKAVYRRQGERINDKHCEVIIRQMMKKVRVTDAALAASGTIAGVLNCGTMTSGAISQVLVGWLLDIGWDGRMADGVRVYSVKAFEDAFLVFVVCGLISLITVIFIRETYAKRTVE